jgi:hypothetical protein
MWRRSNIKEGRHVGLDFYDLLIEAHYVCREYKSLTARDRNGW